jgi:hypothetical protein
VVVEDVKDIYGPVVVKDVKDIWTCIGGRYEGFIDLYWWKI